VQKKRVLIVDDDIKLSVYAETAVTLEERGIIIKCPGCNDYHFIVTAVQEIMSIVNKDPTILN
jgi:hypothetical protein